MQQAICFGSEATINCVYKIKIYVDRQ